MLQEQEVKKLSEAHLVCVLDDNKPGNQLNTIL